MILVDTQNLPCPLPLLKTKKNLNLAKIGEQVIVLTNDSNSKKDIKTLCEKLGYEYRLQSKKDYFEFQIKKNN